jgi:gamma-glutamyltranspeptidase/glutathione hydrolase
MADMAAYTSEKREPVCLFYRQWLICGMGPPSSGGLTTLQILGILQSFNLSAMKPGEDGQIHPAAAHLIAEASKLAFADRNTYIADEDFVPVPSAGMLDPGYLELRAREISSKKALGKAVPGNPGLNQSWNFAPGDDSLGISTTHFSIIDGEGNAVSMTSSIENTFGSRMMVDGFLINSQLTDFSFIAEKDGKLVANHAAPGKRPRSSMAPTLVIDANGKVVLAIGSPGGSHIIGYVAQAIIAALEWDMDIQSTVDMPHIINRNGTTDLEAHTGLDTLIPALEALGHTPKLRAMTSGLHGIRVRDGKLYGGADRRREGVALSD